MYMQERIEDNIVIVTLCSGKTNSINGEVLHGLDEIIDRVNNEEALKGLIITGNGRFFSSGFDLETFINFKTAEEILTWFKFEEETLLKLFTCSKPAVAAINGHAVAAGMIISMACDYRIVVNNPKTKLGMSEIKIGLALTPAEAEIMKFGLDSVRNYKDVVFSGEFINPSRAIEMGIFDQVVDSPDDLIEQAKQKVVSLIDTPGRPYIMLKRLFKQHSAQLIREGIDGNDWTPLVETFFNEAIINTLRAVQGAMQ